MCTGTFRTDYIQYTTYVCGFRVVCEIWRGQGWTRNAELHATTARQRTRLGMIVTLIHADMSGLLLWPSSLLSSSS